MTDNSPTTLKQAFAEAAEGHVPSDDDLKSIVRGSSGVEQAWNRNEVRKHCLKIAKLAEAGLSVQGADAVEEGMTKFGRVSKHKSDQAAQLDPTREAAKFSRSSMLPSKQASRNDGRARGSIQRELSGLFDRAAAGEQISDAEIKKLAIKEEVSDAELAKFKGKLTNALDKVREYRGDLEQRDGRQARMRNAADLADRYVSSFAHDPVLDDQDGPNHDDLPTDPRQLADMVYGSGGRRS